MIDFDELEEIEEANALAQPEPQPEAQSTEAQPEAPPKAQPEPEAQSAEVTSVPSIWSPWEPFTEDAWAKWPRAGPGERPTNMPQFKKVVNEVAKGEFWGLEFPFSPKMLREWGPGWLTRAMHTAGTLPKDNKVLNFTSFDVKAEDVTSVGNPDDNNWGGAGCKVLLSVEYKRQPGPGEPGEHMFIKLPHEFTGKNERYRNSVTASGDWPECMFYNVLGGRLPFRTPRGYFADMSRKTTNFIIVTERIPYGDRWDREYAPGEIYPAPGKYRDWTVPCALDLYYGHARAMTQLFAWHYHAKQKSNQVDLCFMDQGSYDFRKMLFSQVEPLSPKDRDKFFIKSLTDPMLSGVIASSGFGPSTTEGFLSMAEGFIKETAVHCFPKEYTTKAYLDRFFSEAREMSKYVAEMSFYTMMMPEYLSLAHPNAQLDNAFYWRDESGEAQCGLVDWGSCQHASIPVCISMGWIGAEPAMLDEHEEQLSRYIVDEYHRLTGVKFDYDDFLMHLKLASASVLYGCCANVRWCIQLIKKEHWKNVKDRYDKQIDDGFLLRCYFVQLEMFLGMWKKRSPYPFWQKWMSRTGMPRK